MHACSGTIEGAHDQHAPRGDTEYMKAAVQVKTAAHKEDRLRRMTTVLRHLMLLQKSVPRGAKYYSEGVGLQLRVLTETWAELDAGGTVIALKACEGYAN